MPESKISVVIPTHNRAQYLSQALDSVFAQTYPAAEIIIIDDGSTDNTRALLDPLIDKKSVRYFFQQQRGASAARNKGISLATFPFIAFLDSDDLFLPSKLEKQMRVFERHPDLGFVHCWFSKFNDAGQDLGIRDTSPFSGTIYPKILHEWSVLMAMPCMLVRTNVVREVGGFDERMTHAEDMDLWRRIAIRYAVDIVPEVLTQVRVHSLSTSYNKAGDVLGFAYYLEKAFAEDPNLSWAFKQRARAKMYAQLGLNLLGDGHKKEMQLVRLHEEKALASWPFQVSALATWFFSFMPLGMRQSLATALRKRRYPAEKSK